MAHPCPNCGETTEGSFSEGGHRWAICEICMYLGSGNKKEKEVKAMSEEQAEYTTRLCGSSLGDCDIDYTGEVEMLCFRYWRKLDEPKPEYTKWFYTKRKSMVAKLFTPEKE